MSQKQYHGSLILEEIDNENDLLSSEKERINRIQNTKEYNQYIHHFPSSLELYQILFADETLLWADRLSLSHRIKRKECLIMLSVLIGSTLLECVVIAGCVLRDKIPAAVFMFWSWLPLAIFLIVMLERSIGGSLVRVVTNYRVMECIFRSSRISCKSLSYSCISAIHPVLSPSYSSLEFTIEPSPVMRKVNGKVPIRKCVFENVPDVHELESLINKNKSTPLDHASFSSPELYASEKEIPEKYSHIFEESNYIKDGAGDDPEGLLGTPLYITEPNKYRAWWSKASPILLFWLWVTVLILVPSMMEDVNIFRYSLIALLWLSAPFILSIFVIMYSSESIPVDVLTNRKLVLFRTGLKPTTTPSSKACNWGPYMLWYSYRYSFPHETEINLGDGSGSISFSSIDGNPVKLAKGPELVAREELIFRMHCTEVEKEALKMSVVVN